MREIDLISVDHRQAEYVAHREDLLDKESVRRQAQFSLDPASPKRLRSAEADDSTEGDSREIANSYDLTASARKPRRRSVSSVAGHHSFGHAENSCFCRKFLL